MFEYSIDGNHFLGVRKTAFGKTQMVYNFGGVDHRVYDVDTPNPPCPGLECSFVKSNKLSQSYSNFDFNPGCPKHYLARIVLIDHPIAAASTPHIVGPFRVANAKSFRKNRY